MGISAFQVIATGDGAFNVNDEFLIPSLQFTDIPDKAAKVIQIQIETDQAAQLQVTTNDGSTWSALNNATAVSGLATFTMEVRKGDILNFRNTDVAGLAVKLTVAE